MRDVAHRPLESLTRAGLWLGTLLPAATLVWLALGPVAQLIEYPIANREVAGEYPARVALSYQNPYNPSSALCPLSGSE